MTSQAPASGTADRQTQPGSANPADSGPLAMAAAETEAWVERVVIGLELCPFAKAARAPGRTRCTATAARDAEALLTVLCQEMELLVATAPAALETTLLVHPFVLQAFDDYNEFLDLADAAIDALGCSGVLQIASFHPHYRFEGTAADDIGNATNRSPHPMLQLLREDSVAAAAVAFPDSATIYEANIATLMALGPSGWTKLRAECRRDAEAALPAPPDA
jgi:hypothetical protein